MGSKYPRTLVTDFLDKNPDATFTEFKAATHSGMVPSNFTYIRRKYREEKGLKPLGILNSPKDHKSVEKRSYFRRRSFLKIYSRIWSRSTENMPKETKEALNDLVSELNRSGRTNWQLIELTTPPEIEIREVTKQ